jgi:hypothetical protein
LPVEGEVAVCGGGLVDCYGELGEC